MQIPETPSAVGTLDLLRRLEAYSAGTATWHSDGTQIGAEMRNACQVLLVGLVRLESVVAPLLDRITTHEMETFTMHDRKHALKVAHLMWHILAPERRARLSPPEIGMLVAVAHLHDLGMALSPAERARRLDPESDLWEFVEVDETVKSTLEALRREADDQAASPATRMRARQRIVQAEEALLTLDTRRRHATRERYEEVLARLAEFHRRDPARIPDVESCLSFDGDSFRGKIIDVCVSHNQDASALVQSDPLHFGRPRFPRDYPIGRCNSDLHMVAAALRLADILDFDRERTPPVLFYYLLPTVLAPEDDLSVMAWSRHLAISNWLIDREEIVFRGHCRDHVVHHTIVNFCVTIAEEISATRATFGSLGEATWPFALPSAVHAEIFEEGYHYVPYQFEFDGERVYGLLMGGAIYDNPLVAVRELLQNAVDACRLRDALTRLHEPYVAPAIAERIALRYEEPTEGSPIPRLVIEDTGTGMDGWIIERWFLKVGRSYYTSADFAETRMMLSRQGLDFAPVSEFGIGFLSCFLLADRVVVETAMWEAARGDTRKRTLQIDGPTRLIRLHEEPNEGVGRFKGTRVTLYLTRGTERRVGPLSPATWDEIRSFVFAVCTDLPYRLKLEHVSREGTSTEFVDAAPLTADIPPHFAEAVTRIAVNDAEVGLEGEIALINPGMARVIEKRLSDDGVVLVSRHDGEGGSHSDLLRGGFRIGPVPGLPDSFVTSAKTTARLRLKWESRGDRRYLPPNLARNDMPDRGAIFQRVVQLCLCHFLDNVDSLAEGEIFHLTFRGWNPLKAKWLEKYDAYTLYRLARQGWVSILDRDEVRGVDRVQEWEAGRGGPLWLGPFDDELHWQLFDLIMPRIASLRMGPEARFWVNPPVAEWREIWSGWRDFVTVPCRWGLFVEFVGGISSLLAYDYSRANYLNSGFRDRLRGFPEDVLPSLLRLLRKLVSARSMGRSANLSPDQTSLFRCAVEELGDLEVGSIHGAWRIESFRIT